VRDKPAAKRGNLHNCDAEKEDDLRARADCKSRGGDGIDHHSEQLSGGNNDRVKTDAAQAYDDKHSKE